MKTNKHSTNKISRLLTGSNNDLNFIDLFAGAGGLSEGFIDRGFYPIAHVEMNPEACLTLKTRACYYYCKETNTLSTYHRYMKGAITRDELYSMIPENILDTVIQHTMSKDTMPDLFEKLDTLIEASAVKNVRLIVGGPPCQAYSLVGRAVVGAPIKNDPRNYLYQLYCRVLKKYEPEMFVFENVPGLLNADNGRHFSNMKKEFRRFGYDLQYRILNAFDFGVLQNRLRVILIGWKKGTNHEYPEFDSVKHCYTLADVLSDLPSLQAGETRNIYRTKKYSQYLHEYQLRADDDVLTWNIARPHIERDRNIYRLVINAWNKNGLRLKYTELPLELRTHNNQSVFLDRFKVVASDLAACHTVMAHISKDGHYFIHPDINQARSLTVREAARIQSFPDNFFFEGSRTSAFTQIGNAVPPLMAKGIAKSIRNELETS
jgi:DNA (cytosine-5)-methyltransferase 1